MDRAAARLALLSFLLAAPSPASAVSKGAPVPGNVADRVQMTLVEFADAVAQFINLAGDDGRRVQAFVAAAIEVVLPKRTTTPESIHDPSRTDPGDVKSLVAEGSDVAGALFVEAKDKVVRRDAVRQFQKEVFAYDRNASAGYAAMSNIPSAEQQLPDASRIPGSETLTRESGVPTVVWKSPLELLAQVAVWSGAPAPVVVWQCAMNYRHYLDRLDTGKKGSPQEWEKLLLTWGFIEPADSEQE